MSAPKGIDIRQTGQGVLIRVGIDDNAGNALASGTAALRVLEFQANGSVKQLDFSNNTLTATAPASGTTALAAQTAPDGTVTGLWTCALSVANCAAFTVGNVYVAAVTHSALPGAVLRREWQYGSAEGDVAMTPSGTAGVAYVQCDAREWNGSAVGGAPLSGPVSLSPLERAAVASAVWGDTNTADFKAAGSPGLQVMSGTPQSGDAFARLGANGAGLTAVVLAPAQTFSTTGSVATVASGVTVASNRDKAGYTLSASGLDAIAVTAHTGPAATFPQMAVQLWRRFFAKATVTQSQLVTYADDGATVLTTQALSDDGTTQTQGAAS